MATGEDRSGMAALMGEGLFSGCVSRRGICSSSIRPDVALLCWGVECVEYACCSHSGKLCAVFTLTLS